MNKKGFFGISLAMLCLAMFTTILVSSQIPSSFIEQSMNDVYIIGKREGDTAKFNIVFDNLKKDTYAIKVNGEVRQVLDIVPYRAPSGSNIWLITLSNDTVLSVPFGKSYVLGLTEKINEKIKSGDTDYKGGVEEKYGSVSGKSWSSSAPASDYSGISEKPKDSVTVEVEAKNPGGIIVSQVYYFYDSIMSFQSLLDRFLIWISN